MKIINKKDYSMALFENKKDTQKIKIITKLRDRIAFKPENNSFDQYVIKQFENGSIHLDPILNIEYSTVKDPEKKNRTE